MTAMTMEMRPAGRRAVAVGPARTSAPRMRLTARGRMARQLLGLALAFVVVLLLAWQAAGAGGDAGPQRIVVGPGETLSHVAVEHLPGVPVDEAVLRVQEANGLGTSQVEAGQELVIPQR
ncbi:LysM peptidoglycan-binding domain-containing protein [Kytococcus sedentarius]|uniref:LysM peptidoglycan-binding domain-containing protein n=1 Tax=Kytococcus sedentarius TaxID=1276 RepID=UPI0035BC2AB0